MRCPLNKKMDTNLYFWMSALDIMKLCKKIFTFKELLSRLCPFSSRMFLAFSPASRRGLKPSMQIFLWLSLKSRRWHSCPQYWAILQNEQVFNSLFFFINCSASSLQLKQNRLFSKLIFLLWITILEKSTVGASKFPFQLKQILNFG